MYICWLCILETKTSYTFSKGKIEISQPLQLKLLICINKHMSNSLTMNKKITFCLLSIRNRNIESNSETPLLFQLQKVQEMCLSKLHCIIV